MNLKKFIDKKLGRFLPSEKIEPKILHKAMRYSVFSGGKRIRPVILIESAMACGGSLGEAVAAACAVEFIHTYSLIHDDLPSMDDDDYRRGKPSCHKKFGEANAILAGDALLTLAFGILAGGYPPGISVKMIKELSSAAGSRGMVGGQSLDIEKNKTKDPHNINRLKTAKLFEAAAAMGAISANAGKREIEAMRKYGADLGMAFQMVDNILDEKKASSPKNAEILITGAKTALNILGRRAETLKEIADYILNRIN